MGAKLKKKAALVFFNLVLAALLSCSTSVAKEAGYYPVQVENPDGLRLFFVKSEVRDGDFLVSGKVRRSRLPGRAASFINVSIRGLDGEILSEQSVNYSPPVLSRHKAHDDARFHVRFDSVPEEGTVIRVGGAGEGAAY